MSIIMRPVNEATVLAATGKNATAEDVYKGIVARAECCVVHLCGCSKL